MHTEQKLIEDASDDEIRTFIVDVLSLEVSDDTRTRPQLLALMDKAWKQPFIHVQIEPEGALQQTAVPDLASEQLGKRYQDDPKVELMIATTGYPGGKEPASVSVNGTANLVIQREKRVSIPYRFYLALVDAHEMQTTPDSKGQPVTTRVSNYPLTDVKLPPQAEIDAWFERTKDAALG